MSNVNIIGKIANATGSAAKSFLGLSSVNSSAISSGSYRGGSTPFGNSGWLFDGSGVDKLFNFNGLSDVIVAYEKCAPVFSIINKQAYAFINGMTEITNISDKKDATSKEALKIKKLLRNPNPIQNNKQFEAQLAIYLRLFGYCVIYPIKPAGFPNYDADSWWIIPPYMCELKYRKEKFANLKSTHIEKIIVKYGNEEETLLQEDVIIIRDITPGFDNLFLSGSPIKPLQQNISNLIGIYDSKGTLINYRGALGILTPEIDPNGALAVSELEKKELQDGLLKYGLKSGQWKFIVANSAMKWQQMGISYKDLQLTEWAEDDTRVICDGLNYPFRLLANTQSSSLNGTEVDAFKKILYQDFVIPFAEMIYEQIEQACDADKLGIKIYKSYSHVAVLQEDDVKRNTARLILNNSMKIEYEQGLITMNQWLTALGYPTVVGGDIRATDVKGTTQPLATILGVGGIQSLIGILTASNISEEARSATVQILFGISPDQASLMTQAPPPQAPAQVA
jgi:hypothetical protein